MNDEQEISDWFKDEADESEAEAEASLKQVIHKTRRATAQKDTMELVFVKIWAAMMVLLAPLFASAARQQATAGTRQKNKTALDKKAEEPDSTCTSNQDEKPNNGEHPVC